MPARLTTVHERPSHSPAQHHVLQAHRSAEWQELLSTPTLVSESTKWRSLQNAFSGTSGFLCAFRAFVVDSVKGKQPQRREGHRAEGRVLRSAVGATTSWLG